jgi:peptide/nickel transport system permease protein
VSAKGLLVIGVKRLLLGVLVLLLLSFASFCFFASDRDSFPTGKPILSEYWTWLTGVGSGRSLRLLTEPAPTLLNRQPTTMLEAFGHTVALLGIALLLVVVFSVALALAAASKRGSALDVLLRSLSYLAWGLPVFLLALLVQKLLNAVGGAHGLGPFPLAGWPGSCPAGLGINAGTIQPCAPAGSGAHYAFNLLRYVTLPAATLAVGFVGLHGRYLRSALLETLDAPFVTTARAKGLSERRVLISHALRASLATFVSALLSDFGAVFGAAMAIDWIFELNGLGTVLVNEFPVDGAAPINTYSLQLVLLITGALVIASSFLSELAVGRLDPRMRGER